MKALLETNDRMGTTVFWDVQCGSIIHFYLQGSLNVQALRYTETSAGNLYCHCHNGAFWHYLCALHRNAGTKADGYLKQSQAAGLDRHSEIHWPIAHATVTATGNVSTCHSCLLWYSSPVSPYTAPLIAPTSCRWLRRIIILLPCSTVTEMQEQDFKRNFCRQPAGT